MKIAICDDQPIICDELECLIESVFLDTAYEYTYSSFYSGDDLLKYLKDNPCDFQIYLLDIEMDGANGLETAEQIRREDKDAVIIFITSHQELMPQAFRVLAFEYIVKPLNNEVVTQVLQASIHLLEQRKTLFLYSIKKKTYSVYLTQIEYIESLGRKIIIHTVDKKTMEYNGSLKDALIKVNGATFAQAHKSYVINLEQVAKLESWQVTLRSGMEISVGKKYHAAFHAAYRKFMLQYGK